MNIAVLFEDYNSSEHYLKNLEPARNVAKFDKTNLHTYHHVPLKKLDAIKRVKDLILSKKYDLFINLCEDLDDGNGCGQAVTELLHKMNVAYTGAGPKFYPVSKIGMKIAAVSSDVSIPDFVTVESMEELREDRLEKLGMPLLVKHATGHDSLGMTDESRVTSRQQLFLQVEQMLKHFGGAATIEQFIDGPEYTVLVVENADDENDPVVFTPVQCHFSNGHTFKHFDLKWTDYNNVKYAPVIDQKLAQNLKEASKRIFMTCHGEGYARCDFRMNSRTGVIYFLEINTNPSVFYEECSSSADHILNIDPMGFDGFIKLIVKAAFKRKERSAPRIKIEYDTEKGFHVVASRDIAKDEKIYSDEVATLTSGKYAREHWTEQRDPLKCSWLKKYAFLIGHDVYRTWHEEADKWLPINHSCDPNAWICYDFFIHARKFINKVWHGVNFSQTSFQCTQVKKIFITFISLLEQILKNSNRDDLNKKFSRIENLWRFICDNDSGEEITIDYGTFAIVEGEDNEFECRCGSIDCRRIVRPSSDYKCLNFRRKYENHLTSYVESLVEQSD